MTESHEQPKRAVSSTRRQTAPTEQRRSSTPSGRTSPSGSRSSSGAPRRRKRRRHMNPLLYILLVISASALLAGLGWTWACDVLALNKPEHSAVITLASDIFTNKEVTSEVTTNGQTETVTKTLQIADVDYVTDLLEENGLIEYKFLFKLFCSLTGVEKKGKILPGTYELNTDMDYHALINALSSGSDSRMTVTVTIPEGYNIDQIFALLEEKGVSTVETLQSVAANYDYKFTFLKGVRPLGDYHRLEGYLFPDTYEFYMGGGEKAAVQVLNKMMVRLSQLFTDDMRAQAEEMGYTFHEILTIASLIEKETDGDDQATISSVIYNRLERPTDETVGLLQIDATLVYALGRTITQDDYTADTPYNTYTNKGLPPTPIANPGLVALNAALNPENTKYYYYVLGNDGTHHFFRTHQEHQNFIAQQKAEREQ